MQRFKKLFPLKRCVTFGMIHVGPLPGTPKYQGSVENLIETSCLEAEIFKKCSIDAVIIENMHDVPYIHHSKITPEVTAMMTRICSAVRQLLPRSIKCGVQILASANKEALAVAQAANLDFIRAEGFVFGHVADEGYTDSCAGDLLRYRRNIQADNIMIFTDIKKKHSSHAITSDITIEETAKAAEFFLSDGVIVTGMTTGHAANVEEVSGVKKSVTIPVLVGSGVTSDNVGSFIGKTDGVIVGTHFKKDERWENMVSEDKVKKFMDKMMSYANKTAGETF
ncbi:uncharacterized protein F13E9.13, mitochondrial [Nilaparvata lugens]|uniref:uncharacterized protein F13E9.13, mitochondrial n=1 Tax=Nilaparvata lugens TaxID=108931 RepID=UPI000B98EFE4|nr:uncharacterized protein F13E9.13, mitochondrial [Nilaparvata lugens]